VRVVLDTNVFISGVFFAGPPAEILAAWGERRLEVVLSPEILGSRVCISTRYWTSRSHMRAYASRLGCRSLCVTIRLMTSFWHVRSRVARG
jgi:hypothetical protein